MKKSINGAAVLIRQVFWLLSFCLSFLFLSSLFREERVSNCKCITHLSVMWQRFNQPQLYWDNHNTCPLWCNVRCISAAPVCGSLLQTWNETGSELWVQSYSTLVQYFSRLHVLWDQGGFMLMVLKKPRLSPCCGVAGADWCKLYQLSHSWPALRPALTWREVSQLFRSRVCSHFLRLDVNEPRWGFLPKSTQTPLKRRF